MPAGATWATFADGISTATAATVTGLANGQSYVFRVEALNVAGAGSASALSARLTPRSVASSSNGSGNPSTGSSGFDDGSFSPYDTYLRKVEAAETKWFETYAATAARYTNDVALASATANTRLRDIRTRYFDAIASADNAYEEKVKEAQAAANSKATSARDIANQRASAAHDKYDSILEQATAAFFRAIEAEYHSYATRIDASEEQSAATALAITTSAASSLADTLNAYYTSVNPAATKACGAVTEADRKFDDDALKARSESVSSGNPDSSYDEQLTQQELKYREKVLDAIRAWTGSVVAAWKAYDATEAPAFASLLSSTKASLQEYVSGMGTNNAEKASAGDSAWQDYLLALDRVLPLAESEWATKVSAALDEYKSAYEAAYGDFYSCLVNDAAPAYAAIEAPAWAELMDKYATAKADSLESVSQVQPDWDRAEAAAWSRFEREMRDANEAWDDSERQAWYEYVASGAARDDGGFVATKYDPRCPNWHHVIPNQFRRIFGDSIDEAWNGWFMQAGTHQALHDAGWNPDIDKWIENFREQHGKYPTIEEAKTFVNGLKNSDKYRAFFDKGFQAAWSQKDWHKKVDPLMRKIGKELAEKVAAVTARTGARYTGRGMLGSIPIFSIVIAAMDYPARASELGHGAAISLTILDNIPIVDIAVAVTEGVDAIKQDVDKIKAQGEQQLIDEISRLAEEARAQ